MSTHSASVATASVTRRSLLGAAAVGAVGAGLVAKLSAGQALAAESTSLEPGEPAGEWLGQKPAVAPEDCAQTLEADVVVLGAGIAGSAAAYAALLEGASVVVLEKGNDGIFHIGGPGFSFINSQTQLAAGQPQRDPAGVVSRVVRATQGMADANLVANWAFKSGAIFDELVEKVLTPKGVSWAIGDDLEHLFDDPDEEMMQELYCAVSFMDNEAGTLGDFGLLNALHGFIEENGGQIVYGMAGQVLVQDEDGAVTGVIAQGVDGENVHVKAAKGVVVCTGGYSMDPAMMAQFYTPAHASLAKAHNIYTSLMLDQPDMQLDTGDGQKMLCWAGGHMALDDHSGQYWTASGYLATPYLMVNQRGERFTNESLTLFSIVDRILRQDCPNGYYAWQVFNADTAIPNQMGSPKEVLDWYNNGIDQYVCDTVEELAENMGVDQTALQATIDRYNELVEQGCDEDYGVLSRYLAPITAPYKAIKVICGFATTTSGVEVTGNLEVVGSDYAPIPGLYAAGNTVGNRFGCNYQGVIQGMSNALAFTHGYLAAKHCVATC